jgi:FlaA1/EpsC-like NDP-sugar epimerase
LIFGAGEMGKITQHMLENDHHSRIHVLGFIDDDKALIGSRLVGKPIYSEEYVFKKILTVMEIHEIILAIDKSNIEPARRKALFDRCLTHGVSIREISPFKDWTNGNLSSKQIKDVKIEDLLGREPIQLNTNSISKGLKNSVVLVTGAAGSIGSEIVRQLMTFELSKVILLDQAESPLYDLQNELLARYSVTKFETVVASVTDRRRMRHVFEKYRPQYVFNAAAYKHVPLMEAAPYEAIRVNVGGTCLLADLSVEYGVNKFVMISTDKAINPTNVMGASKRICEIYIQALAQSNHTKTKFITTRFGNVLGSNGSVIPLFKKQIETGGPVTVTHREIIRYFMTIPEACQLVLESGFMGSGGEIYMFDMGEPVKIYDLAVKMISLAGLRPEEDIPILITGLRPGEKLFEELLADRENTIHTHHPKIKVAKVRPLDFGVVKFAIDALLIASQIESEVELVCRMKSLVPEFISQNSEFSKYDKVVIRTKQKLKQINLRSEKLMNKTFQLE